MQFLNHLLSIDYKIKIECSLCKKVTNIIECQIIITLEIPDQHEPINVIGLFENYSVPHQNTNDSRLCDECDNTCSTITI